MITAYVMKDESIFCTDCDPNALGADDEDVEEVLYDPLPDETVCDSCGSIYNESEGGWRTTDHDSNGLDALAEAVS